MKQRRYQRSRTYGLLEVISSSPTSPIPEEKRRHQLTKMWQGLRAMEVEEIPQPNDWRVVSDAINLMETLVKMGHATDDSGLLNDAIGVMAAAGQRHMKGLPIRLSGEGIQIVRAVLEDYAGALEVLSHRTMVMCHAATEKRLQDILAGRKQPHDVEIVDL